MKDLVNINRVGPRGELSFSAHGRRWALQTRLAKYDSAGNLLEESVVTTAQATKTMNSKRRQKLQDQIAALEAMVVKVV